MSQTYADATEREVELVDNARGFFEVHHRESGARVGRIHDIGDASAANSLVRHYDWLLIDYPGQDGLSLWKMWLE